MLYGIIGLFEAAIRTSQEYALRTIKGVYFLLDNPQNWIRVHVIKMVGFHLMQINSLVYIEPRLAKKVEAKIYSMLVTTNGKSVECELLKLSVNHFLENSELFELVKGKMEIFLESNDINLNIIGFKALKKMIKFRKSLLNEYMDKLSEKAKQDNPVLAGEIFSIYEENITMEDADTFLKEMRSLLSKENSAGYKEVLIGSISRLILRKDCRLITDLGWLVQEMLFDLYLNIRSVHESRQFIQILWLIFRDFKEQEAPLLDLSIQILFEFFQKFNPNSIKITSNCRFEIILEAINLICVTRQEILYSELIEKQAENFENFCLILIMVTRIISKLDILTRTQLQRSLLILKSRLRPEDQKSTSFLQEIVGETFKEILGEEEDTAEEFIENEMTYLMRMSDDGHLQKVMNCDLSVSRINPQSLKIECKEAELSEETELTESESEILTRSMEIEGQESKKKLLLGQT